MGRGLPNCLLPPVLLLTFAAGAGAAPVADSAARVSDAFVRHLAELINDYRQHQGLAPLLPNEDLERLAGEHSTTMAETRQLSHDGFSGRFQRAGSPVCVENVGWNYPTPERLLDGWRLSPSHQRNLLEPRVSHMGIAVDARYVTFLACR